MDKKEQLFLREQFVQLLAEQVLLEWLLPEQLYLK